jgi:hypothetical protein
MMTTSVRKNLQATEPIRPGAHSEAGSLLSNYKINGNNSIYVRYNQFNGDPMTGQNVRAVDIGYFRPIGKLSRLTLDYQFKNRPSFEDDAVNGRFQITWQILLGKPEESGKSDSEAK